LPVGEQFSLSLLLFFAAPKNIRFVVTSNEDQKRRALMKVFAIATPRPTLTPDKLQQYMPAEVPATLQHYLDGTVEQFWFREKLGPIFLMNVESVEQANASLAELPLVANDLMTYEVFPVTPLSPLRLLIHGK
jgi:hypothetical protein